MFRNLSNISVTDVLRTLAWVFYPERPLKVNAEIKSRQVTENKSVHVQLRIRENSIITRPHGKYTIV